MTIIEIGWELLAALEPIVRRGYHFLPLDVFGVRLYPERIHIEQGCNPDAAISFKTEPKDLLKALIASADPGETFRFGPFQAGRGSPQLMQQFFNQFRPVGSGTRYCRMENVLRSTNTS